MSEPSNTTTVDQGGESFDLGDSNSPDIADRLDAKLYGAEDGDAVASGAAATGNVNLALLNASVADEASLNSDELITSSDSTTFSGAFLGDDNSGSSDASAGRAGDESTDGALGSQTQFSGPTGGGSSSIPQTESFTATGSKDSNDDLRDEGSDLLEARDPAHDDSGTGSPPDSGSTSQDNPPNDGGGSGPGDPPNGDSGSGDPPDDGDGITDVIDDVVDEVTDIVDDVVDGVTDVVNDVVGSVGDVVDGVTDVVNDTIGAVTDTVNDVVDGTTDIVDGVVDAVSNTVDNVGEAVDVVVDNLTDTVADVIGEISEPLGEAVGGVTEVVDDVVDGVTDTVSSVVETADDLLGDVTESVDGIVDGTTDAVEDLTGQTTELLDDVVNTVGDTVGNLSGSVDSVVDDVTNLIDEVFGGGADDLSGGSDDTDLVANLGDEVGLDVNLDPVESLIGDIDLNLNSEIEMLDGASGAGLTDSLTGLTEGLLGGSEDEPFQGSGDTDLVVDLNPSEDGNLLDVDLDPIESLIGEINASVESETEILDDTSGAELIVAVEELAGGVLDSEGEEAIEDVEALLDLDLLDQNSGTDGSTDGTVSALDVEVPDLTGSVSEGLSGLIDDSGIDGLGGLFG